MTERLYEQNAYLKSFEAVVVSCEALEDKFELVLDKTAFFPEGGGQPADKGTINGKNVLDVQQKNDVIVHLVEEKFEIGETVSCELDWDVRYARMQGHTGEHILSGVVNALYKYDNVGFHMSEKSMLVDFNGSLTAKDIKLIELKANEAVYKNADVIAYFPSNDEIETLEYRSKKEVKEALRIVKIGEDIDCCACCAPHVDKTGEVGIIKVIDFAPYKQGTRLEMMAGKYALLDYIEINANLKDLMKLTSSPRNGVVDTVNEKYTAYKDLSFEYQKVSRRLALSELDLNKLNNSVYAMAKDLSFDDLRYCANSIMENEYDICVLFSKSGDSEYSYVVSSKTKDVRPIVKSLNETFNGKGGGKSDYSQGKINSGSEEDIIKFVQANM